MHEEELNPVVKAQALWLANMVQHCEVDLKAMRALYLCYAVWQPHMIIECLKSANETEERNFYFIQS